MKTYILIFMQNQKKALIDLHKEYVVISGIKPQIFFYHANYFPGNRLKKTE